MNSFAPTPIPYPFPVMGEFDYELPEHIECMKQEILWDREIKRPKYKKAEGGYLIPKDKREGVYIWHENHHAKNKVLYVGHSGDLLTRLYQHCHEPTLVTEEDEENNYSPVLEYIFNRPNDMFRPCSKYPNDCDCIPRFFVRLFYGASTNDELELIHLLKPCLSGQIAYWERGRNGGG